MEMFCQYPGCDTVLIVLQDVTTGRNWVWIRIHKISVLFHNCM